MAEGKKSFILYSDHKETWEELSDEQAGKLIKHIFRYVNDENPELDDPLLKLVFIPMKQSLKRDLIKWEGTRSEKSIGGRFGNLKRWHKDLYNKVKKGEISLEEAEKIASDRKASHTDDIRSHTDTMPSHPIASIAVSDNVNVSVSDIYNTLSKDQVWIEAVLMTLKMRANQAEALKAHLKSFLQQIKATEEINKPIRQIKGHFVHWANKNPVGSKNIVNGVETINFKEKYAKK